MILNKKIPFPTLYLGVATLPRKSSKEKIAKEESTVSDMATLPRRSSRENSEKDSSPITVRSNSQPSNWSPPTSVKGTRHHCEMLDIRAEISEPRCEHGLKRIDFFVHFCLNKTKCLIDMIASYNGYGWKMA